VVAAALLHPFSQCIGIELLPELFKLSLQVKARYDSFSHPTPISYLEGDIFHSDWSDASVILVNSTCFYTDMIERISQSPVQPGCIAISLTRQLSSSSWELLQSSKHKMSWGASTLHIQRKLSPEEEQRRTEEIGSWLGT
jgi:hypothetical protein